jgi:hypothetical protein
MVGQRRGRLPVSVADNDGQSRIFFETAVSKKKLAKQKLRSAVRLNLAGMHAVTAQARIWRIFEGCTHAEQNSKEGELHFPFEVANCNLKLSRRLRA